MSHVQVLVVGGGPAGALVARGLAAQGREVLVIEARSPDQDHVHTKPCGEFIAPRGVAVLERAGLRPLVEPAARILGRLSLTAPGGTLSAELGSDALAIRREDLDRILLAAAEPAAQVRRGCRMLELERLPETAGEGPRWQARLSDGDTITCDLLVGADGRHSRVRQETGLGRTIVPSGRHALVVRARGVQLPAGIAGGEMHLGGLGQIGLCPLGPPGLGSAPPVQYESTKRYPAEADEVNLNLLLSPAGTELLGTIPSEDLVRRGLADTPSLAARCVDAEFSGPVLAVAHLRQMPAAVTGPGVALVGDAALCGDPFTGEGMSNALDDGERLLANLATMPKWSGAALAQALTAYAHDHRRSHRRHRFETRALPFLLNHPAFAGCLVAGLARLGLGQRVVGDRHRGWSDRLVAP